ncbi:hypothetical protein [Paenibacillus sp. GYB004]|uniref:hypothetical protein n=1 Tax=Paenibacillus sp. GYB004 TaxID=2994393 RepID=UPI003FA6F0D0
MLSLNTSVLQLAMAAGAGIGGIVVERVSLAAISWIGAAAVTVAAGAAAFSLGMSRSRLRSSRIAKERSILEAEV